MSTPKEVVLEQLHQVARFETSLKRPLIDAGWPDIPLPMETLAAMVDRLPELPPEVAPPEIPAEPRPVGTPPDIPEVTTSPPAWMHDEAALKEILARRR